jgi:hypothetical protein
VVQYAAPFADKWTTLGVAQYRAGDWTNAIAALEKSESLPSGPWTGINDFFLAMAHWQVGEKETARGSYAKGVAWRKANQPRDQAIRETQSEATRLLGIDDDKTTDKKDNLPLSK